MLKNEARWLQAELARLPAAALTPLLSIASGQETVRTRAQPWIGERVFAPLQGRGVEVFHHERDAGPGIDVVGDLQDAGVVASLSGLGARSVLCCNVLEHVEPRSSVTRALEAIVAPGGFLIVTVPHRFPYHPDPVDTMFRPSVADLEAEFSSLHLRRGDEVACGTLWRYLLDVPHARESAVAGARVGLARLLGRAGTAPPSTATGSAAHGGTLRYLTRQTAVTCAIFERVAS